MRRTMACPAARGLRTKRGVIRHRAVLLTCWSVSAWFAR